MPAPEPGPETAMFTFGFTPMNSSAHTALSGVTVFEPIILIDPESVGVLPVVVSPPPQLVSTSAVTSKAGTTNSDHLIKLIRNYPP